MKGKIPEIASSHISSRVLQVFDCYTLEFLIKNKLVGMWLFIIVADCDSDYSASDMR